MPSDLKIIFKFWKVTEDKLEISLIFSKIPLIKTTQNNQINDDEITEAGIANSCAYFLSKTMTVTQTIENPTIVVMFIAQKQILLFQTNQQFVRPTSSIQQQSLLK